MATANTRYPFISSAELARRYLAFFTARGHQEVPGAPLAASGTDTSFVIAGMQPLLPYLRGEAPPPAPCLTDLQRCLRTDDIEAVGTNGRKITSFQMLGNWSIGDYGPREAIALALELLDELRLDRDSLWVTTFGGDADLGLPPDTLAVEEWRRAGIAPERIVPLGTEDNLWPPTGGPGLCGPCTEIYVDRGEAFGCGRPDCKPGCDCERFLEIWNLVFITYELTPDGRYIPLAMRSVDTGMGLERTAAVLQNVPTVYETDLFAPGFSRLTELAPVGGDEDTRHVLARRIVVDHARAALFAGLAGVLPDRDGRGSVLRRLIRRAARQGRVLGLERPFLGELLGPLAAAHEGLLSSEERARVPELARMVTDEERRFTRVLTAGLRTLETLEPGPDGQVPGERLFMLHAERGFPADLAAEILVERGLTVDWQGYERALEEHHAISRAGLE
ncbi:MAG TPA: alanine--tRNA ligase-related protein [Ktedonobacterales bacterium]|nr:alanine--tRNA ligase-related protein [Ktedonobacterales bacterium]